jgi:site-specific DNA-cytosine methylase
VLEDTVAEHYQAGEDLQQNYKGGDFLNPNYKSQANTIHNVDGKSGTICAGTHGYANGYVSTPRQVGTAIDINGHDILKRVYSPDGKSPTLNTMGGGNRQPKVVTGAWRGRYKVDGVRQDHKGSVAGRTKQMLELRKDDKTNALTTVQKDNVVVEPEKMNWRKLSVVECERLQTVDDNYTEGVSNTQRYKMLGNGFTVEIISHILSNVSPGQQQKKVDS